MTEPTSAQSQPVPFDPYATSMGDEVAPEVYEELFAMRRSIDNFDAALVHILAERFQATKRVGLLKAKHNLPAGDPGREEAQVARLRALAKESSLDPEFAEKFLNFIISEVIRHHMRIAAEQQDDEQGENPISADHAD